MHDAVTLVGVKGNFMKLKLKFPNLKAMSMGYVSQLLCLKERTVPIKIAINVNTLYLYLCVCVSCIMAQF